MNYFSCYQFIICKSINIIKPLFQVLLIYMLLIANIYSNDEEKPSQNTIENNSAINSAPPSINDDEHVTDEDEGFANEDISDDENIANEDDIADEDQAHEYTIKQAIDDVYGNIFTRSRTEEELISYLNTLIPDDSGLNVGVSNYAIKLHQQNIYNRVIATRNNYNTIKCQSLDFYKNNKFTNWNMASMGASHRKSIDKTLGYNNKSNNFIIGIDSHWSNCILGCSLGYDRSIGGTFTPENIKRDQHLLQNSFLASIYLANYVVNKLFCCAIVSLGSARVEASRLREAAKMSSSYNTRFNKYHLSASYEFNLLLFNIEPEIIAKFTTINIDSYKNIPENRNISATNSEFHDSIKDQIFDIGLGVSLTQTWMLYDCFIVPKIKSTLYTNMNKYMAKHMKKHMNNKKTVAVNTKFMLEDYNADVVNKYANIVETELGLDLSFKKVNLSIYYNFSKSKYYNDNSFAIKLNIPL